MQNPPPVETDKWVGVDLNTNGHAVVAANPNTGKVFQEATPARKQLQLRKSAKKLTVIKRRESPIIKDVNHKISTALVGWAKESGTGIKFALLKGMRQTTKQAQSFQYSLNSWCYCQLPQFVDS